MCDWPVDVDDEVFKLILPAGKIPLGSTVTKRTGNAQYTLGNVLRVYGLHKLKPEQTEPTEIKASDGVVFLIDDGKANAISAETELVWHATRWQLENMLDPPDDK